MHVTVLGFDVAVGAPALLRGRTEVDSLIAFSTFAEQVFCSC